MLRKFIPLCGLFVSAVVFGQSDHSGPANLETIEKYVRLGMYDEATAAIENAIKQNEFDPHLRYVYGDVLFRQERYDEALKQFELWSRLDAGSWQALQRVATTAE